MADASLVWKAEWLKIIRDMPAGAAFMENTNTKQDLIWIQDLERDGYISARFRMGYSKDSVGSFVNSHVPNAIYDVHILDKGRQLIMEFENPKPKVEPVVEVEHTLLSYWRLADWEERLGMVLFLGSVFTVGYLCASNQIVSRFIALIRDMKP